MSDKAVFSRLSAHADNKQAEKERIERDRIMFEREEAKVLANRNRQKVMQEGPLRTKHQFLQDQIIWEHKKVNGLQTLILKKEEKEQNEVQQHNYTPKINTKSSAIAKNLNLDNDMAKRLNNKVYLGQERTNKHIQEELDRREQELIFKPQISENAKNTKRNI
jgi:predicted restriction endonuclease